MTTWLLAAGSVCPATQTLYTVECPVEADDVRAVRVTRGGRMYRVIWLESVGVGDVECDAPHVSVQPNEEHLGWVAKEVIEFVGRRQDLRLHLQRSCRTQLCAGLLFGQTKVRAQEESRGGVHEFGKDQVRHVAVR